MKRKFIFFNLILALALMVTPSAMAIGTPAGTAITNRAYVDYKDANGNALTRIYSNTVTTTVSQVAAVDVVPASYTDAGANGNTLAYHVEIFNNGNGTDTFTFTYALDAASAWTPTSVKFYYDVDHSQTYNPAVDTVQLVETSPGSGIYRAVNGTGNPVSVAADDDYDFFMLLVVPAAGTAPDTTKSIINITAKSDFDNAKTDTGTYTAVVASAVITSDKSHTPNIATHAPLPGETIKYKIVLTNNGSTSGTGVVVSDPIPAGLTYKTNTIKVDSVAQTDGADADKADYNLSTAGAVTFNLGTIAAGVTVTVEFDVTVNSGVTAGTSIKNQASVSYSSGGNPISAQTDSDALFVGTSSAVDLTATTTSVSGNPGDTVTFPITVTNNGNSADVIDITYSSTAGWTYNLWYDANNDGIAGNDGDFLLTDTDNDGVIDTGSLPKGGTAQILAVATIPAGTADQTKDTLVVTGTSSNDITISDPTQNIVTTVKAPLLAITKTVSPTGAQPPGTTLTYTVAVINNGTGVATNVVISDLRPAYTTFVSGSLKTGAALASLVTRTDASDGDSAEYDAAANSVVAGGAGNPLGPGGSFYLQFQVTIN